MAWRVETVRGHFLKTRLKRHMHPFKQNSQEDGILWKSLEVLGELGLLPLQRQPRGFPLLLST